MGGIDAAITKEPRRCELADSKRHSTFGGFFVLEVNPGPWAHKTRVLITETCFGNQIGNTFKYLSVYPFSLHALTWCSYQMLMAHVVCQVTQNISTDEGKLNSFGLAFLFFPIKEGLCRHHDVYSLDFNPIKIVHCTLTPWLLNWVYACKSVPLFIQPVHLIFCIIFFLSYSLTS